MKANRREKAGGVGLEDGLEARRKINTISTGPTFPYALRHVTSPINFSRIQHINYYTSTEPNYLQ